MDTVIVAILLLFSNGTVIQGEVIPVDKSKTMAECVTKAENFTKEFNTAHGKDGLLAGAQCEQWKIPSISVKTSVDN